jgi:hypothetical protein
MKQVVIGTFEFGYDRAVLILREGFGGNGTFVPDGGGVMCLKIGADHERWQDIVECLLHEVEEMILSKMDCSYIPGNYIGKSSSSYHFAMSHQQFTEVCARTAEFITPALPKLSAAWKKWKKKKGKEKHAK